ncbi:MAG TPA: 3'(2'),5'-bisphosphate nucleotidase [Thermoanaerobaculia bacterium]|nr:3'(2'),5'-bisphosphate nucleotidase [Thermoanaerobaculia bacterium]
MSLERELRLAVVAVERAARLCRAVQAEGADGSSLAKQDRSPVTVADFGAQALVSLTLDPSGSRPPIVGEERADALRGDGARGMRESVVEHVRRVLPETSETATLDAIDACHDAGGPSGRRWVLDPIDGTKGYLRGGQYAIALALLEDGAPVLGVLGCPALDGGAGALFVAERGAGAQQRSLQHPLDDGAVRPISVDSIADPHAAVFCESVEAAHSAHDRSAEIARRLGVAATPVRIDSQTKYAVLARGEASIYLRLPRSDDYREKIWDHAAGWIVLTEAGGRITDALGRPLDFSLGRTLARNRGVIATNGRLHDAVMEAVLATSGETEETLS